MIIFAKICKSIDYKDFILQNVHPAKKQPLNLIPGSVFIPVFAIIPSRKIPGFHPTFAKSTILQNSKIMHFSSVFPYTKLHKIKLLPYCDRAFVCNKVG